MRNTLEARPAHRIAIATLLVAGMASVSEANALPLVRTGSSATPAGLQPVVDQFRDDLGGANNGAGGSYPTGRREINWDGVPDTLAAPNYMPADFYNVTSARGVVLNTVVEDTGSALNRFQVSATAASGTPVRFGNLDPAYPTSFIAFSAQRLFTGAGSRVIEVNFFVPGTNEPAVVSGFGVVFADVDLAAGGSRTAVKFIDASGRQAASVSSGTANNGLSFVGATFPDGEKIARVIIISGTHALGGNPPAGVDVDYVAMDDMIYGEPESLFRILEDGFESP